MKRWITAEKLFIPFLFLIAESKAIKFTPLLRKIMLITIKRLYLFMNQSKFKAKLLQISVSSLKSKLPYFICNKWSVL